MWIRTAALLPVLVAATSCDGSTDCTELTADPTSCSVCGMDEPLPPVEGTAIPDRMFLGVGNPYWFYRTELTLTSSGSVQMSTLSESRGDRGDDGEVTRALAGAILAAALPALVDILDRPEIERIPDEPVYEFELRAGGEALGPVWYAESEVLAAPPLCCVAEAFQQISQCVGGHAL